MVLNFEQRLRNESNIRGQNSQQQHVEQHEAPCSSLIGTPFALSDPKHWFCMRNRGLNASCRPSGFSDRHRPHPPVLKLGDHGSPHRRRSSSSRRNKKRGYTHFLFVVDSITVVTDKFIRFVCDVYVSLEAFGPLWLHAATCLGSNEATEASSTLNRWMRDRYKRLELGFVMFRHTDGRELYLLCHPGRSLLTSCPRLPGKPLRRSYPPSCQPRDANPQQPCMSQTT